MLLCESGLSVWFVSGMLLCESGLSVWFVSGMLLCESGTSSVCLFGLFQACYSASQELLQSVCLVCFRHATLRVRNFFSLLFGLFQTCYSASQELLFGLFQACYSASQELLFGLFQACYSASQELLFGLFQACYSASQELLQAVCLVCFRHVTLRVRNFFSLFVWFVSGMLLCESGTSSVCLFGLFQACYSASQELLQSVCLVCSRHVTLRVRKFFSLFAWFVSGMLLCESGTSSVCLFGLFQACYSASQELLQSVCLLCFRHVTLRVRNFFSLFVWFVSGMLLCESGTSSVCLFVLFQACYSASQELLQSVVWFVPGMLLCESGTSVWFVSGMLLCESGTSVWFVSGMLLCESGTSVWFVSGMLLCESGTSSGCLFGLFQACYSASQELLQSVCLVCFRHVTLRVRNFFSLFVWFVPGMLLCESGTSSVCLFGLFQACYSASQEVLQSVCLVCFRHVTLRVRNFFSLFVWFVSGMLLCESGTSSVCLFALFQACYSASQELLQSVCLVCFRHVTLRVRNFFSLFVCFVSGKLLCESGTSSVCLFGLFQACYSASQELLQSVCLLCFRHVTLRVRNFFSLFVWFVSGMLLCESGTSSVCRGINSSHS